MERGGGPLPVSVQLVWERNSGREALSLPLNLANRCWVDPDTRSAVRQRGTADSAPRDDRRGAVRGAGPGRRQARRCSGVGWRVSPLPSLFVSCSADWLCYVPGLACTQPSRDAPSLCCRTTARRCTRWRWDRYSPGLQQRAEEEGAKSWRERTTRATATVTAQVRRASQGAPGSRSGARTSGSVCGRCIRREVRS